MPLETKLAAIFLLIFSASCSTTLSQPPVLPRPDYDSTLYFMFWWEHVADYTAAQLANEAAYIQTRIGSGPYVKTGFSTMISVGPSRFKYPVDLSDVGQQTSSVLSQVDSLIVKARAAGIRIHLHFFSFFYGPEGANAAASQAVGSDPRNAQWYYTPSGGPPQLAAHHKSPGNYWATPSRYAAEWMEFKQRYFETLGVGVVQRLQQNSDVLISIDWDAELSLSDSRYRCDGCPTGFATGNQIADYSPFAVGEFRDWLTHKGEYCDACAGKPNVKYKGQGKTGVPSFETDRNPDAFNSYYGTSFSTWDVEGFDSLVGQPIPGGFAAPFFTGVQRHGYPLPSNPQFLAYWFEFRELLVKNALKDSMTWLTSSVVSPGLQAESSHPARISDRRSGLQSGLEAAVSVDSFYSNRIYASQIPAEYLDGFALETPHLRYFVSGSGMATGDVRGVGSPGWTAFNYIYDGTSAITRTTNTGFFNRLETMGLANWGIMEWAPYAPVDAPPPTYNLWVACRSTADCIAAELNKTRAYKPHVLAPFTYETLPGYAVKTGVKQTPFESALKQFIDIPDNRYTPRLYAPGTVFLPPKLSGLIGVGVGGKADLAWSTSIFPGINDFLWSDWPRFGNFELYRGTAADMADQVLVQDCVTRSTSCFDVPSNLNQRYYYRARALNSTGSAGAYSDLLSLPVCAAYGDMDAGGTVTSGDADKAMRLYLGLDSPGICGLTVANVYRPLSTGVTPRDALLIHKKANGDPTLLPVN